MNRKQQVKHLLVSLLRMKPQLSFFALLQCWIILVPAPTDIALTVIVEIVEDKKKNNGWLRLEECNQLKKVTFKHEPFNWALLLLISYNL